MGIAETVKSARKSLALSQMELALVCDTSRSVVQKIEQQQGECYISTIRRVLSALDLKDQVLAKGFDPYMDIGSYLLEKRAMKGWGIRELSRRSNVSRKTIRRLLASAGDIEKTGKTRICTVLKLSSAIENSDIKRQL